VRIVRLARLLTPAPIPVPMRQTHVIVAIPAPTLVRRALPHERIRIAGPPHRSQLARPYSAKPVWDVAGAPANAGASLAGSGVAASGNGTATNGGGAAASGAEPCGFVTFSDPHGSQFDPRTRGFHVDIRMSVHFADGTAQSMILDYAWYYASEADKPWSDRNLKDPGFPTRFQTPPPDKAANEPSLVRYVMQHSTTDGMTLLRDCPSPPA